MPTPAALTTLPPASRDGIGTAMPAALTTQPGSGATPAIDAERGLVGRDEPDDDGGTDGAGSDADMSVAAASFEQPVV